MWLQSRLQSIGHSHKKDNLFAFVFEEQEGERAIKKSYFFPFFIGNICSAAQQMLVKPLVKS